MPKFEVFTKRMVPLAEKPYVTIQKRGNLALNKSAHAALGEPKAVELLFDPEAKVIGFRAIETDVEHAYPIRSQGGKDIGPYLVAGTAFTKYYGIDTTMARRFPATMDDGVLCIDLSQPGTVVSSNRKGRGRHQQGDDQPAAER
ncbi:hypothetical protein [Actinophytocola gossypii]|uniref:Uncharacterized protein n=1 Tax=Actinophytocola gossypii TaxID=2812003 RepID=A0ABT2JDV3_9PSEU|nr:hypothetical protein [Actinophytocola gossypii]MCT2586047.1 hypothetical protein [Actinophytocola gossypii]